MSVAKRKKTLDGRSGTVTDLEDEDVEVGSLLIGDTTQSTSTITGALQCRGGVGISKNLYIGGNLNVGGTFAVTTLTASSTTDSTSTSTGAIITPGGIGCAKTIYCKDAHVTNTTASGSTTTGALVVTGGLGVGGNLNVGGTLNLTSTTDSSSTSTGSLVTAGGVGIAKTLVVGQGLTVFGNYNLGGYIGVGSTQDSTSSLTGSINTLGGIGCRKTLYIGNFLTQDISYITRPSTASQIDTYDALRSLVVLTGGRYESGSGVIVKLPPGSSTVGTTIRIIGLLGSPATGTTFGGDYFMGAQPCYVTTNSGAINPDQVHYSGGYYANAYLDAHEYDFTFTNIGQKVDAGSTAYYTWEARCNTASLGTMTVKWARVFPTSSGYNTTMTFNRTGDIVAWTTTQLTTHTTTASGWPSAYYGSSVYTVLPYLFTPGTIQKCFIVATSTSPSLYIWNWQMVFNTDGSIDMKDVEEVAYDSGAHIGWVQFSGTYCVA